MDTMEILLQLNQSGRVTKNKNSDVVIACLEAWWVLVGEITSGLFEVWRGLGHGGEARDIHNARCETRFG